MSEEHPLETQVPQEQKHGGSMGESFRIAREQLGMDIGEAAEKLRLSRRQLTALEADDLSNLPSPAFTRGFIRNYARLLNLDPDPLLDAYRVVAPDSSAGNAPITLSSAGIPIITGDRKTWLPYLIAALMICIGGGAWWVYMDWRDRVEAVKKTEPQVVAHPVAAPVQPPAQTPEPQTPVDIQPTPPATDNAVSPESASVSAVDLANTPASPSTLAGPQNMLPVAAGSGHVVLKFSQPSWVRVTDRDGKEVLHINKPADSEEKVDGMPPFKIEIGNAAGVQLTYNGQPVDLSLHTRANVARLTLE